MQQGRWDRFIYQEMIEITGMMIIRSLWTLLTLGSFAAAVTRMALMQVSSTSVGTQAVTVPAIPRALFFSDKLYFNRKPRLLDVFIFSYNFVSLRINLTCYNKKEVGEEMKKILIIEDDKSISSELAELLASASYDPIVIENFLNPLEDILNINPDLILLDINIPHMNGEILLQNIRHHSNIPVVMVTARNNETDEVLSYSYGADDYVTKPYNPNILLLRIAAIFKRIDQKTECITYKNLKVNLQKGIIENDDVSVILTKNEMIIFSYLLNNQNRIVERDELMTDLWNNNEYINDNALTVNISRLRAKLKELGIEESIETRKGIGYILL